MKNIYPLLFISALCAGLNSNTYAQCLPGEVQVFIDVTTDGYGYETYWELVPSGNACGTGTIFAGGNTAVGCGGGGLQAQAPGGYGNNITITEGPWCLVIGQNYDIKAIDDWGDGGPKFEIVVGPVFIMPGTAANSTFTFTAQAPPNNNLQIKTVYYDTLGAPLNIPDSMSTLYYAQIPRRQAEMDFIVFGAAVKNNGLLDQSNVKFTTTVNDGTNNIYIQDTSKSSIVAGATDSMIIGSLFTPLTKGTYGVTFAAFADSTDAVPGDNTWMDTIRVSDTIYARDNGSFTNAQAWWYGAGVNYEIGNMLEIFTTDTATSISYYNVTSGTSGIPSNVISLNLYDAAGFGTFTPLVSASFYTITAADTDTWITRPIPATVLAPGEYVVTVETFSNQFFVSNQVAPPLTTYVDPDNSGTTWYYTDAIPWIRLNTKAPQQVCAVTATANSTNLSCPGDNSGTASVTAAGGTGSYTYAWNNVATTSSITGLSGGNYSVTITDANACKYQVAFNIIEPGAMTLSATSTNVTCNGGSNGSINSIVTGGTSPFTYTWSDTTLTIGNRTGLMAGTYNVTVSDANGCPGDSNSIVITQPAALGLTFTQTTANCGVGGTATVSVTGGLTPYTYVWNDPGAQATATATGLLPGAYTATVTDSNGCVNSVTDSVFGTALVTVTTGKTDPSSCVLADGFATASATTGTSPFAYSWDDPGNQVNDTASGLAAGIYNVTVTDFLGCFTVSSVTLVDPGAPTLSITSNIPVSCKGGNNGAATVTAFGGTAPYAYSWNTVPPQANDTASGLAAGVYNVTVTDNGSCSNFISATITEPASAVSITSKTSTNVSCGGSNNGTAGVVSAGGTGAYTYSWNTVPVQTTQNITGVGGGTYTVTVSDANGCTATDSVVINEPAVLGASAVNTNITCFGAGDGEINLTVTGGTAPFTYTWSTVPAQTTEDIDSLGAGIYSVAIVDTNGCTANSGASITEPTALVADTVSIINESSVGASNGAIDMTVSGGTIPYNVTWTGPGGFSSTSIDISGLAGGNYTITVTDAKGCIKTKAVTVSTYVGISEASGKITFSVYPNPNTGQFYVELNNLSKDNYLIEVRNIIGQLIISEKISNQSGNYFKRIELSTKENGVYFISLKGNNGTLTQKLVVY